MSEEAPNPNRNRFGFWAGLIFGLVVGGVLVALAVVLVNGKSENSSNGLIDQARQTIEESYWRETSAEELDPASVEGMVDFLREEFDDDYSYYFDAEAYASFQQSTSGSFSGVGMTVSGVDEGLRVVAVIPGSPAEAAGLEPGDFVIEADGESLAGMSSKAATELIKGPAGTTVKLTVITPDDPEAKRPEGEERVLEIERADVRVPAVAAEMIDDEADAVGYIRFGTFSRGAADELRRETERLISEGAEGLVIDMRGNGGGLFQEAVFASDVFVEEGVIVTTSARSRGDTTYEAEGNAIEPALPIVVLVNGDSASSSEIFTAALADNGVATVVGTETFGKGVFQEVIGLPAGGALDLTVGEFFTPDGVSLAGDGIDPDVEAEDDPDTRRQDEGLEAALTELAELINQGG